MMSCASSGTETARRLARCGVLLALFACGRERPAAQRSTPPASPPQPPAPTLEQEITQWREKRVANLRGDEGWLTVIGLHWLKQGANLVGSAKSAAARLPQTVPAMVGTVFREGTALRFIPAPGAAVTRDGKPAGSTELATDEGGKPTVLEVGTVRFHVIKRGNRFGLRVKDREAKARKEFHGIDYYDIDPKWRVWARLEPYNPPRKIPVANVIGTTEEMTSPGSLAFEIDGQRHRLDPVVEDGSKELFIIFGDKTNGRETYGGGRYLYASMPPSGNEVILDFNKGYNPPCVFTAHATCPLPPPQNKLPIAITAGEKNYRH